MVDHGTVSVVIPTYNRRELVLQAVGSVLYQTYPDLVCTIVDNGSSDGTVGALRAIEDPRVRVIAEGRPIGGAAARNLGISASAGAAWVAFLDSDDLWAPDKLQQQLDALHDHPGTAWSTTACVDIGPDLMVRHALRLTEGAPRPAPATVIEPGQLLERLQEDNFVPAGNSTVLVSRELLEDVGGFDGALFTCDDWDLWIRVAKRSALTYVDLPLTGYRVWDGQSSNDASAFLRDAATVRARYFPGTGRLPRAYSARWARELARRQVAQRQRVSAARSYFRAAQEGRAPGQLAYGLAVLVAPELVERRLRRVEQSERLPDGWAAQAEPWLARWRQV
jgi:GT2 family glycosyltransferase